MARAKVSRANELGVEAEARIYRALRHFWHPVAYSHELTDTPLQVFLCGEQLCAVRLDGEACVFEDLCAHRGTALSLGTVVGGELRCAYHGWQYDRAGDCTFIPQRPDLSRRLRARVKRYRAKERYGMVWASLVDEPHFPLPEFPQYDDPAFDTIVIPWSDWRCSAPRRTENYWDLGHFAIVHDGVLGDVNHPEVPAHRVWREDRCLRMALTEPFLEPRAAAKAGSLDAADEPLLEVMTEWWLSMPLTVLFDSTMAADQHYCLFFHPTPLGPRTIRNFTVGARNYGSRETMEEQIVEFNYLVYGQDKPIVESQRPEELPEDLSAELHLKGVDTFSIQYRKWLLELANELESASTED
jgi:phenylpropionate dioxygenase-like ring-hydroxylating dioxygenase large terminal subunit